MFKAIWSDPQTFPDFSDSSKFCLHIFQCGAFDAKEKTPAFKCGFKATSLAIFSEKPDDLACL